MSSSKALNQNRHCQSLPDPIFTTVILMVAMLFTTYLLPRTLPSIAVTRGFVSKGYSVMSSIVHIMALVVALKIMHPSEYRPFVYGQPGICPPKTQMADQASQSISPIWSTVMVLVVVKFVSFFIQITFDDEPVETQDLVRIVLAMCELLAMYFYTMNMSENAAMYSSSSSAPLSTQQIIQQLSRQSTGTTGTSLTPAQLAQLQQIISQRNQQQQLQLLRMLGAT